MSWNESGGNKNSGPRNPWDRKPESGPPDLDELLRGLRRRLGALFGGRGTPRPAGAGGAGDDGGVPTTALGLGVLILLLFWVATGFYMVGAAERGVVTRFGKYTAVTMPGANMHLPWPIESRQLVNTQEVKSFPDRTRMLTRDEALVDISFAVQYRRADPVRFVFSVVEPEQTLGEASESAIREIVGRSTLNAILETERQQIAVRTKELIQRTLDGYKSGLEVISVNLQDVSVPEQVAPAQKDAIKAREDKQAQQVQAERYANEILPTARGGAERQLLDAEAYRTQKIADAEGESSRYSQIAAEYERAPAATRQRLYIETMEAVYGGTSKILVDTKGTGNMIYLPLDKLLERRGAVPMPDSRAPTLPEVTVTPVPRSDAADGADGRTRSRGSR